MAHGGTNFGFYNGANTGNTESDYQPDLTSYDYVRTILICLSSELAWLFAPFDNPHYLRMHQLRNPVMLITQSSKV